MRLPRLVASLALTLAAATGAAVSAPAASAVPAPARSHPGHHGASAASTSRGPQLRTVVDHSTITNPNSGAWSGYQESGAADTYTSVASNWIQPAVLCTSKGAASFWVGLDGASGSDPTVEQTGVTVNCASGSAQFTAWWETYPAATVNYSVTVSAGDSMSASVSYSGGVYSMVLTDHTRGWTESTPYTASYANSSAEVIAEAPNVGGTTSILPDFTAVQFTGSTINGAPLSAGSALPVLMENSAGTYIAEPGTLSGGGGTFTVTYGGGVGSGVAADFQSSSTSTMFGYTDIGPANTGQAMRSGTSPATAALATGGYVTAFQAPNSDLIVTGPAGTVNTGLGMAAGTSPSIAASPTGGYQVAFQANTGVLWTYSPTVTYDLGLGMAAGTSPGIAGLSTGGYEETFQANTGFLYVYGTAESADTYLGVKSGTSPAIAAAATGGFEVAFQATGGTLWTFTPTGAGVNQNLGMAAGSSPAIAAVTINGYEIAVQISTGTLTVYGVFDVSTGQPMAAGTSPAIAAVTGGGYEAAYHASAGGVFAVYGTAGNVTTYAPMASGTNPTIAG